MEITIKPMKLICPCGGEANEYFTRIGITADYQLYVQAICPRCQSRFFTLTTFEQLMRDASCIPIQGQFSQNDVDFLKEFHIKIVEA